MASDKDMMKIGEHCSVESCHQLDFLPVTCSHCAKIFCKVHSSTDGHNCTLVANNVLESLPDQLKRNFKCQVTGCTQSELVEVRCEHCDLNFCLKHRHQVDHVCSKITEPEEKMKLTQQHIASLPAKEKPKSRGRKSSKTAAKVMLMKLKMKAVGDKSIPDTEKTFLLLALPDGSKEKNKAVVVSKKWSIGRVIDVTARLTGLNNSNNVGGSKKLRLFNSDDGIAFDASLTLETVEELISGSVAILEYVPDSVFQIDNLDGYTLS